MEVAREPDAGGKTNVARAKHERKDRSAASFSGAASDAAAISNESNEWECKAPPEWGVTCMVKNEK